MKDTTELNAEEAIRIFTDANKRWPDGLHQVAGAALCVLLIAIDTYRTCAGRKCRGCRSGRKRIATSTGEMWHEPRNSYVMDGHYCVALFENAEIDRLKGETEKLKTLL